MKTNIILLGMLIFLPLSVLTQTAEDWIAEAEAAEAVARAAEKEADEAAAEGNERQAANKKLEAQNAWREAGTARASAAEKQVEEGDYERAAEHYKRAGDHFEKAGNHGQAAAERKKASSNFKTAADNALADGDESEAERLEKRAEAVDDEVEEPIAESKAAPERAFDAVVTKTKGTGQTTGHIATITVRNNSDKRLQISPQIFYIPSDGKFQSYVGRIPPGYSISPGEQGSYPVHGWCTEVSKPPVPLGSEMPNIDAWVPVSDGTTPAGEHTFQMVPGPNQPSFEPGDIADVTNSQGFQEGRPTSDEGFQATWPGTDRVVEGTIRIDENPDQFGPVIVSIVEQIESAAEYLIENEFVTTPFSGHSEREFNAIVQQTVWYVIGLITGQVYTMDEFEENVRRELQTSTGTAITDLSKEEQEDFSGDVQNFWNSFTATGVAAKVLNTENEYQVFPHIEKDKVKERIEGTGQEEQPDATEPVPDDSQDEDEPEPESEPECLCKIIEANIKVMHVVVPEDGPIVDHDERHTFTEERSTIEISPENVEEPENFRIDIGDITVHCECSVGGEECEVYGKRFVTGEGNDAETHFRNQDEAVVDDDGCDNCRIRIKPDDSPASDFDIHIVTDDLKDAALTVTIEAHCKSDDCVEKRSEQCKRDITVKLDMPN